VLAEGEAQPSAREALHLLVTQMDFFFGFELNISPFVSDCSAVLFLPETRAFLPLFETCKLSSFTLLEWMNIYKLSLSCHHV